MNRSTCGLLKRPWVAIGLTVIAAACAHSPIISDPGESPGDPPRGTVKEITAELSGKSQAVAVFIHGVGDHCPGFALDPDHGWLNDKAVKAIGLVPKADPAPMSFDILDTEFLPDHPVDQASKVTVATRTFDLRVSMTELVTLRVIELTWSQLTQWVKTIQLGYDLTEATPPPVPSTADCPFKSSLSEKKPPSRVLANRLIKEQLLDRSLSDALLYSGTYGRVMRRGIAEGLCLALGGTKSEKGKLCKWPQLTDERGAPKTAYFFVTHSLGSRLLYDTLLGLTGVDVTNTAGTFTQDEITDSAPYAEKLLVETASVFMMANQLPMLGLAYEDGTHTSTEGPSTYEAVVEQLSLAEKTRGTPVAGGRGPTSVFRTSVVALGVRRLQAAEKRHRTVEPLKVVAFSDPNDLLSWGIPNWYQRAASGSQSGLAFTNVYVQNGTHWFGVYESPTDAHDNYFKTLDVWHVIRCGAANGSIKACPQK